MRAAITKTEIESEIASRFGSAFKLHEKRPGEFLSSGVSQIDSFIGGLPRGAITEIFGPASSGRTSFMLSAISQATRHEEVCALIDTNNAFDPQSAARAQVKFDRLLWIRSANNLEHAFKAADLLLQAGGFGLVMLDLGDVPAKSVKRIISSWWYRFRRTLEATPTALVVIAEESAVRSCAALALELRTENCLWLRTENCLWSSAGAIQGTTAAEGSVVNESGNSGRLSSASHRVALIPTPSVAHVRWQRNQVRPSHANLLRGLSFQVECRRPLYLKREVSCNAAVSLLVSA